MNIANIKAANRTYKRIESNKEALDNVTKLLEKYPNGNSDGSSCITDKEIYTLHVSECSDGSGDSIDLAGSLIQTEVLEFIATKLKERIEEDYELMISY